MKGRKQESIRVNAGMRTHIAGTNKNTQFGISAYLQAQSHVCRDMAYHPEN